MNFILVLDGINVTKIGNLQNNLVFEPTYEGTTFKIIGAAACPGNDVVYSVDLSKTEVTIMENSCFSLSTKLKTLILPKNVESIGFNAFHQTKIEEFNIPASLISMDGWALNQCPDLVKFTIAKGNSHFYTEGTCLYTYDKKTLLSVNRRATSEKDIPFFDTIEKIGRFAFTSTDIETLDVPESVKFIDIFGFHAMFTIQFLDLSKTKIKTVEESCFWHCTAKTVKFPNTLTTLKQNSFFDYLPVDILEFPSSVAIIEDNAFYSNRGITKILYKGCTDFANNNIFTGSTDKSNLLIYVKLCYPSKTFGGVPVIVYEKPTFRVRKTNRILTEFLSIVFFVYLQ